MDLKNTNINEFEKIYQKENKKILAIFFGTWCEYCQANIPEIISHFNTTKSLNSNDIYMINIKEDDDVWAEDNNKKWALNFVPTFRIYEKTKVIWEHEKPIKPKKLENVIKKYINQK